MSTENTTPSKDGNFVDAVARVIHGNTSRVQGKFANGGEVGPFILVPEGYGVAPLPPATESPLASYITASPTFDDAGSFASYVKQFSGPNTRVFLGESGQFVGVIDYHSELPARTTHRASFHLTPSPEWRFWAAQHDKWLTQEQIVELLEEHRADVISPSAADLIAVASSLKATESAEFVAKTSRSGSGTAVVLTAKVEGEINGSLITPPTELSIEIPIFKNGRRIMLDVVLNWRGKPKDFVKVRVLEMEAKRDEAIANERELVAAGTGLEVFLGRP